MYNVRSEVIVALLGSDTAEDGNTSTYLPEYIPENSNLDVF
jgi:hypothetical protein